MARDIFYKPNFKGGIQIAGVDLTSLLTAPSYTTTQRNALSATNGMIVYDSTLNRHYMYQNGSWQRITNPTDLGDATSWASIPLGSSMLGPTTAYVPTYNGTTWEAVDPFANQVATTYTPTLSQSGTVTKTVTRARYITIGKVCHLWIQLAPTAAGSAGTAIIVGLPNTAQNGANVIGKGHIILGGTGYRCSVHLVSTTTVVFKESDVTGVTNMGVTPNVALASSGDLIMFEATYELA